MRLLGWSQVQNLLSAYGPRPCALLAAALQFQLRHESVIRVLPGMLSPSEVAANAAMMRSSIPVEFWEELSDVGLIP